MARYDIAEVDAILDEFSACASRVKASADEILRSIADGCAPAAAGVSSFNDEIAVLQEKYDRMCALAQKVLDADEYPADGAGVEQYAQAIANSRRRRLEQQMAQAKAVLVRFISVRSAAEDYAQALRPHQDKAQALLTVMDSGDIRDLSNSEIYNASELFLNTMDAQEPEKHLLAEKAGQYYPLRVLFGLMSDQYHVDAEPEKAEPVVQAESVPAEPAAAPEPERTEPAAEEPEPVPAEEPVVPEPEPVEEPQTAEDAEEPAADEETAPEAQEEAAPETEEEPVYHSLSAIKMGTPSGKSFKRDLLKMPKTALIVLPLLTNAGALTVRQAADLSMVTGCVKETQYEAFEQCMDKLADSKLLAKFRIKNDTETAYCLTSYTLGCIQKSVIKPLLIFSLGSHAIVSDGTAARSLVDRAIDRNELFYQYLCTAKNAYDAKTFDAVRTKIKLENGSYIVNLPVDGETYPSVLFDPSIKQEACENLLVLQEDVDTAALPPHEHLIVVRDGQFVLDQEGAEPETASEVSAAEEQPEPCAAAEAPAAEPEETAPVSEENAEEPSAEAAQPEKEPQAAEPESEQSVPALKAENAEDYAKQLYHEKTVTLRQLADEAVLLIAEERFPEAAALLDAIRQDPQASEDYKKLYAAFVMAADLPVSRPTGYENTSSTIDKMQGELTEEPGLKEPQEAMLAMSALRAMIFPAAAYDHTLYTNYAWNALEHDYPETAGTMGIIAELLGQELKDISFQYDGMGFSNQVMDNLADDSKREKRLQLIRKKALEFNKTQTKSTIHITGFESCLRQMVGPTSTIGDWLSIVSENDTAKLAEIEQYIVDAFMDAEQGDACIVKQSKVEEFIDSVWNEARKLDKTIKVKHLTNGSTARNYCSKAIRDRVGVISDWISINKGDASKDFSPVQREKYESILNQLKKQLQALAATAENVPEDSAAVRAGKSVIREAIRTIEARLNGVPGQTTREFFDVLIRKPYAYIDGDGSPAVIPELYYLHSAEPWRGILQGVFSQPENAENILREIDRNGNTLWYRNYGRARLLDRNGSTDYAETAAKAREKAKQDAEKFCSNVRLFRAYGKVQESLLDTLFGILDRVREFCFAVDDYALFNQFLKKMGACLDAEIQQRMLELRKSIDRLKADPRYSGAEIFENIEQALRDENFVRVNNYILRLEGGERKLPEEERTEDTEQDFLGMFLKGETAYYEACNNRGNAGRIPKDWAINELRRMPAEHRHWSSMNEQNKAEIWIGDWPRRKDSADTPRCIENFLKKLKFDVHAVQPKKTVHTSASCEVYPVSVAHTPSGLKDYPHPVYKYGTDLADTLNVVCLFGCRGVSTLISVMTGDLQLNGPTIVLMDGSLSASDRRRVSLKFKAGTSGQSPFLLIDRVLLLFLASLDEGDRLCAMLKCTLPFTYETLYTNGTGSVPDELFIGRARELYMLTDSNGPCLVYGGRQLGKTALLNRACKILNDPEKKEYSFCCINVKDNRSDVFLQELNDKLCRRGLIDQDYPTMDALCNGLIALYDEKKYVRLTIFVDEVDELFSEYKEDGYKAVRSFVKLMDHTGRHARFVFAGTHNVAETVAGLKENSDLLHLGKPLCIEPLSADDASRLIRRPMSYLGFEIGPKQLELIINNTNSYPGLIHMFCRSLVSSVCKNFSDYYGDAASEDMLPYKITDAQMQTVFREQDIREELGKRVMATIELNKRYHVVASLLAYMIYEQRENDGSYLYGFSAHEIAEYNKSDLNIQMIAAIPEKDLETLLQEMVHMGILWQNEKTHQFRFKQMDFLEYIGSSDEVLEVVINADAEEETTHEQ